MHIFSLFHCFQSQDGMEYCTEMFWDFCWNLGWHVSNAAGGRCSRGCSLSTGADSPASRAVSQPATHSSWVGVWQKVDPTDTGCIVFGQGRDPVANGTEHLTFTTCVFGCIFPGNTRGHLFSLGCYWQRLQPCVVPIAHNCCVTAQRCSRIPRGHCILVTCRKSGLAHMQISYLPAFASHQDLSFIHPHTLIWCPRHRVANLKSPTIYTKYTYPSLIYYSPFFTRTHMRDSIFAASGETVRTAPVFYFRSWTWIIERSGQQCVLHSFTTDLSALRVRRSDCPWWATMSSSRSVGGLRGGASPALGGGPDHCDLLLPSPAGSPPGCCFPQSPRLTHSASTAGL